LGTWGVGKGEKGGVGVRACGSSRLITVNSGINLQQSALDTPEQLRLLTRHACAHDILNTLAALSERELYGINRTSILSIR